MTAWLKTKDIVDTGADAAEDRLGRAEVELTEETCDEGSEFEADTTQVGTEQRAVWRARRPIVWLTYGVIPAVIIGLAACAGYLQWRNSSMRAAQSAGVSAVSAATDSTIKMLSYKPDTVQKDLESASEGLTGAFRDSYNSLTHDVVIPGAQQKQISAVATVPAAAVVSASAKRVVVMVFVNQTTIVGADPPTATASTVRVTLDKVGERWLVSDFTPI